MRKGGQNKVNVPHGANLEAVGLHRICCLDHSSPQLLQVSDIRVGATHADPQADLVSELGRRK